MMLLTSDQRCPGARDEHGATREICVRCDRREAVTDDHRPGDFIAPAAILRRIAHDLTDWHCDNRRSSGYVEAEADRVEG